MEQIHLSEHFTPAVVGGCLIESDRERQAPKTVKEAEPSHLARYQFACGLLGKDDAVLDLPCGTGYGTSLMAENARRVVGVDIHDGAIEHAKECFSGSNVDFRVGDAEHVSSGLGKEAFFDTVVSFEGIEHMQHPEAFLDEVTKVMVPGGRLIISTPRKPHGSPYHIVEFSLDEFRAILSKRFHIDAMYGQIYTDIFDMSKREEDPAAYKHFNFIAVCTLLEKQPES